MAEEGPVTRRWGWLYALVLLELALCIVLLRVFARAFS
jgi:hypothetical protein